MLRATAIILLSAGLATSQVSFKILSGFVHARAGSNSSSQPSGTVSAADTDPFGNSAQAMAMSSVTPTTAMVGATASSTLAFGQQFGLSSAATASMVVRLSSSTPVAGTLQLAGNPLFFTTIDVGNDGSNEPLNAKIPIVIDAVGVEIAFLTQATASAPVAPRAGGFGAVTFHATMSRLLTALPACGASLGARITPDGQNGRLEVTAESSIAAMGTFFVIGLTRQRLPIPPLGCELGTDLVIVAHAPLDRAQRASLSVRLPNGGGASVYMQFLVGEVDPVGNQIWRTSNLLTIVL